MDKVRSQQLQEDDSDSYGDERYDEHAMERQMQMQQQRAQRIATKVGEMNAQKARFPFCITWTPLPCITWILPMIGHTGICDSEGVIHDFAGPYYVSIDDFAFGETHKYVQLDISHEDKEVIKQYNEQLVKADKTYRGRMHNLFCDNCHSHVARVLNNINYQGKSNWNMVSVWWLVMTQGKYVSWAHVIFTYIGFIVLAVVYLMFFFGK